MGVYENATHFAGLSRDAVKDVGDEAVGLRMDAERLGETDFFVRVAGSLVGVVVVLVLGFGGWRIFRRHYYKRFLGLKPEVVSSES